MISFLLGLFLRTPAYSYAGYDPARLPQVLGDSMFREAIALASPVFFSLMEKKGWDWEKLNDREKNTVLRYYNRMCFRPVPFGSFTRTTLMDWADDTPVNIDKPDISVLQWLPDGEWLREREMNNSQVTEETTLWPNPTLYRSGREYRFIHAQLENGKYKYSLDSLPAEPWYRAMLSRLGRGDMNAGQLVGIMVRDGGGEDVEVLDYLRFLVSKQLLYTKASGTVFEETFARTIPMRGGNVLKGLHINTAEGNRYYASAESSWQSGGPGPETQQQLLTALKALTRLTAPSGEDNLNNFIKRFREKFESQRISLLNAIDPDEGICYAGLQGEGTDNSESLPFPEKISKQESVMWTAVHRLFLRHWSPGYVTSCKPIMLQEEDFEELPQLQNNKFPPTFSLVFRQVGDNLLVESAGGATGTALIGRFTVFSPAVKDLACAIAAAETVANPDVIFADIGYQCGPHIDNVNRRTPVYAYEIPLNVRPASDPEFRLEPASLSLQLQGDHLVLWSEQHGKEIIPRMASAFNPLQSRLPVFRLLADLQYQGLQAAMTLNLERFFPGLAFYPRVQFGDVILASARWLINSEELKALCGMAAEGFKQRLKDFRINKHLPQWVTLGNGDQQLVFDLCEATEHAFFRDCLIRLNEVWLTEYFPSGKNVRAGNKPKAGQFVAFLQNNSMVYPAIKLPRKVSKLRDLTREHSPGRRWLYLKIYVTPVQANHLLLSVIQPFLRRHRKRMLRWFFIRYYDPDHHLRLRIEAMPQDASNLLHLFQTAITRFKQPSVQYEVCTYHRELERYGAERMEAVETVFHMGSCLTSAMLFQAKEPSGESDEIIRGIQTALVFLRVGYSDIREQILFVELSANSFAAEFNADKKLIRALDNRYREMRPIFDSQDWSLTQSVTEIRQYVKQLTKELNDLFTDSLLNKANKRTLLSDLIHMQLNRNFTNQQRLYEYMVYHFLSKMLKTWQVKSKLL